MDAETYLNAIKAKLVNSSIIKPKLHYLPDVALTGNAVVTSPGAQSDKMLGK